ncbi:hypothetical protein PsYK624_129470 [Phanerochaete sordida]|uniref:Uncharacterized protein n=1 Tax=Phanerochaete sordida TaxID=48140 RepID=A0A9P3GKN7_9APHY|nr:hypothetical protein PsYK624_129470 [Phanerochaete sordida]
MPTLETISTELVHNIYDFTPDLKAAAKLSGTCGRLRDCALSHRTFYSRLAFTLDKEESRVTDFTACFNKSMVSLRNKVVELIIVGHNSYCPGMNIHDQPTLSAATIHRLLEPFPEVHTLDLVSVTWERQGQDAAPTPTKITTVNVADLLFANNSNESFYAMVHDMPLLSTLRMGCYQRVPSARRSSEVMCRGTVTHLELHNDLAASVYAPWYHSAMSHIPMYSALRDLRVFELRPAEYPLLATLLRSTKRTLQALELSLEDHVQESYITFPVPTLPLANCTNLTYVDLHLPFFGLAPTELISWRHEYVARTLRNLPSSMRALTLTCRWLGHAMDFEEMDEVPDGEEKLLFTMALREINWYSWFKTSRAMLGLRLLTVRIEAGGSTDIMEWERPHAEEILQYRDGLAARCRLVLMWSPRRQWALGLDLVPRHSS